MEHAYCDFCGKLIPQEELKYTVFIEVYAPYEILEFDEEDLERDFDKEIRETLKQMRTMAPEELESDVYKSFQFTICRHCQQSYIRDPLHFKPSNVH